eukprot:CAMPEP_0184293824 /NCGR_PEP_ID=MMETSP1049-20130417/5159_1 /TAXON_ID=77928 /ORGANISM="Proteomonas sulcata, Strain CCMP704" /LENGTH=151 /DNA_ID=CAMNT_0026601907 /DNA_START=163 /DNA_END=615 /DNA_ORIENTATION=-
MSPGAQGLGLGTGSVRQDSWNLNRDRGAGPQWQRPGDQPQRTHQQKHHKKKKERRDQAASEGLEGHAGAGSCCRGSRDSNSCRRGQLHAQGAELKPGPQKEQQEDNRTGGGGTGEEQSAGAGGGASHVAGPISMISISGKLAGPLPPPATP